MGRFPDPRHKAAATAGVLLTAVLTAFGRLVPVGSATTWTFAACLSLTALTAFLARSRPTEEHAYRRFLAGAFSYTALASAAAALTGTIAAVARMRRDPLYSALDDIFVAPHETGVVVGDIGVPYVSEWPAPSAGDIVSIFLLLLYVLVVAGVFGTALGVARGASRPLGVLAAAAVASVAAAAATWAWLTRPPLQFFGGMVNGIYFVYIPFVALGAGAVVLLTGSLWVLDRGAR